MNSICSEELRVQAESLHHLHLGVEAGWLGLLLVRLGNLQRIQVVEEFEAAHLLLHIGLSFLYSSEDGTYQCIGDLLLLPVDLGLTVLQLGTQMVEQV